MIRATVDRVAALESVGAPIIVTNALHATAIEREMAAAGYPDARVVLEPAGRNTAPAVAVAAHEAMRNGDDPILFVLPSDHTIADQDAFAKAAGLAARAAASGKLVTFGIRPDRPETGYGYVKVGSEIIAGVHAVDTFREKPDAATAASSANRRRWADSSSRGPVGPSSTQPPNVLSRNMLSEMRER